MFRKVVIQDSGHSGSSCWYNNRGYHIMAALLAYHASHEQFPPSQLLRFAIKAERAKFDAIHSSDHFHPWSVRQGNSGFAFSWIAAAMQATSLPFSMVCAPGQRYHPAVAAQAIATIAEMFPGRYSVELGSGEAINEMITGEPWPDKGQRNKRLEESVKVIRRLLNGEEVNFDGLIHVKDAKIWSLPAQVPPLFCAAISTETCSWCGAWADGLLTTSGDQAAIKEKIEAFRKNGGAGKPVRVQYSFSYGRNASRALEGAHEQWRTNLLPRERLAELHTPAAFDHATRTVRKSEVAEKIPIFSSMTELFEEIALIEQCGVNLISLHNVNRDHDDFIDEFREHRG